MLEPHESLAWPCLNYGFHCLGDIRPKNKVLKNYIFCLWLFTYKLQEKSKNIRGGHKSPASSCGVGWPLRHAKYAKFSFHHSISPWLCKPFRALLEVQEGQKTIPYNRYCFLCLQGVLLPSPCCVATPGSIPGTAAAAWAGREQSSSENDKECPRQKNLRANHCWAKLTKSLNHLRRNMHTLNTPEHLYII